LKGLLSYYWDINFWKIWQVPKIACFCSSIYTLCGNPVSLRELNRFLGTMPVADNKSGVILTSFWFHILPIKLFKINRHSPCC
jgi:hypothetical protein